MRCSLGPLENLAGVYNGLHPSCAVGAQNNRDLSMSTIITHDWFFFDFLVFAMVAPSTSGSNFNMNKILQRHV